MPGPGADLNPGGPASRLQAAIDESSAGGAQVVAVGWATVELDRAAWELATDLGLASDPFEPGEASDALGASSRIGPGLLPDGIAVVLLEPATEGRLAERLARHGEGPAAAWLAPRQDPDRDADREPVTGRVTTGPFGPERRVPSDGGPIDRFLLDRPPGTIAP